MSSETDPIGRRFAPLFADVDADALRAFARATGEADPIYFDDAAARQAGYRSIVAPLTYAAVLKHQVGAARQLFEDLGMGGEAGELLHAEQGFEHYRPICAGDRLRFEEHVADVQEKRGGKLLFVTLVTEVFDQDEALVLIMTHTEVLCR